MRASEIDEILVSPPRLAILACLADHRWHTFMELKGNTGLADGNLHVQTAKLVAVGYLEQQKLPHGRRTRTSYRMTERGLVRFQTLARQIQGILSKSEGMIRPRPARERTHDDQVW